MFIALCFSHNSLTVRPMQTCPLQFWVYVIEMIKDYILYRDRIATHWKM
jgi:hypothetical protein